MTRHLNFKIGLFFLAFAVIFILLIVPTIGDDWRETAGVDVEFFTIGPRFFPYLSAGIMALLSVLLIIDTSLQTRSGAEGSPSAPTAEQLKPVLVFMAIGSAYILTLPFLGVPIATPLCLMACFWYFDLRKWRWILPLAFGITAVIYFCFVKLMMVPLPMGFLEM